MTSSRPHDVSLYELALSATQSPSSLQISPATFKSMVTTVFDLLIEYQFPATVWLKLPRGDVWQAEIDRYHKLTSVPHAIYSLKPYREAGGEGADGATLNLSTPINPPTVPSENPDLSHSSAPDVNPEIEVDQSGEDQGTVPFLDPIDSQRLSLPLAADSQLRREYFLLVLSAEFCGLFLVHRPRSAKRRNDMSVVQEAPVAIARPNQDPEEELERKQPLLGLCSFETQTIQRILEGINQAIHLGQSQSNLDTAVSLMLDRWDQMVHLATTATLNPHALAYLFTRQIQRQEEIWLSNSLFRKQAEIASTLQMDNEELLNSVRIRDEFLKNVGQELRTPLTTMKTALTLLNSPNLKPAQRQKYMELLSQECDRQSSLITSVLELVQLETTIDQSPAQPLRLTDVVPGVVSTYQPLAQEKGIMLAYTISEELPAVSCLSAWLRQIVINLLHNGIKFTPHGGRVWVRAKQQGDYVQLEFQDTGIGIAAADIPKIFDRFYRVRSVSSEESSGSGLGLSIVQQLLLRCGGSISVRSKPGEGSIFTILLPVYPLT